jgi:hypothetical protein
VIRFGTHLFPHWPYPFRSTKSCNIDLAMLAPYWALTDPYSFYQPIISAVYYHAYTALDKTAKSTKVLKQATSDVYRLYLPTLPTRFKASYVLVVTWHNLRHPDLNNVTRNMVSFCYSVTRLFSTEKKIFQIHP